MPTASEPVLFVLWFRPGAGRWVRVGRFGSRAEALNAIGGSGDWRVSEERSAPAAPTLFDETEGG